jgi:hypothetical protein
MEKLLRVVRPTYGAYTHNGKQVIIESVEKPLFDKVVETAENIRYANIVTRSDLTGKTRIESMPNYREILFEPKVKFVLHGGRADKMQFKPEALKGISFDTRVPNLKGTKPNAKVDRVKQFNGMDIDGKMVSMAKCLSIADYKKYGKTLGLSKSQIEIYWRKYKPAKGAPYEAPEELHRIIIEPRVMKKRTKPF